MSDGASRASRSGTLGGWLLIVAASAAIVRVHGQDWDAADRATRRLPPSAFTDLPTSIRADLEQRACTIPQSFAAQRPENAISGRFTTAAAMDWAVLCSRDRRSRILVYRGGAPSSVEEVGEQADRDWLQVVAGAGAIGYSRVLAVADATYIRDHHKRTEGPAPPPLDHDGISDVFVEKGSVVWYWYQDRWLRLAGAD